METVLHRRHGRPRAGGRRSARTVWAFPTTNEVPVNPDRPLDDVWFTRDLPVLRAIARLVDSSEHGNSPYLLGAVVPASGLPKAQVIAAAQALAAAGYIAPLTNHNGDIVRITAISAEARRLAGLWPTPQGEWDRLLEQLTARAAQAPTDVERQRWRAFADAAAAVGPDDGALLMSALIGGEALPPLCAASVPRKTPPPPPASVG